MKGLRHNYLMMGAAFTAGMLASTDAFAVGGGTGITAVQVAGANVADDSFSEIFARITTSVEGLPGFLSMAAYFMGIVMAIAGILKIKDHVEDPGRTQLKDGAIRLFIGGALFALPFVMNVMTATIGDQDARVDVGSLNRGDFTLK